ncbi:MULTISPECIES: DUF6270 domain-containing protein [Bacillus cereus group]|uniref:DUF6270 domain-containing protein n=3 Tax=Bacillus TaxID=1386 RepID=UPI0009B57AD6|nr:MULTISPECIES: DUF6270 domain-containing protein [Bacillus cereus group]MCU5688561.1 DUF6270 domain-containing protein [Bacillus cereus]MEC0899136.1 DUF6270 domain-containing protein [Bacillus anthracis]QKE10076.1 hypothetical protein HPG46_25355 [Bacillus cereus]
MYKLNNIKVDNTIFSIEVIQDGMINRENNIEVGVFVHNVNNISDIHEYTQKMVIKEQKLHCNIDLKAMLQCNFLFQHGCIIDIYIKSNGRYYPIQMDVSEFEKKKDRISIMDILYLEVRRNNTLSFIGHQLQKSIKLSKFKIEDSGLEILFPMFHDDSIIDKEYWLVFKKRNDQGYDEVLKYKVYAKESLCSFTGSIKEIFTQFTLINETIIDIFVGIEQYNSYAEVHIDFPFAKYKYTQVNNINFVKPYANNKGYLSIYTKASDEKPLAINSVFSKKEESKLIKVAVLGSCVTRDNFNSKFNYDYKRYYECVLLQNQTSIISLMGKPVQLPSNKITELNQWDANDVRSDFEKSFLIQLKEKQPDYLIMDLFGDVFFGCIRLADTYVTNNYWKLGTTQFFKEIKKPTYLNIMTQPEEYLLLWKNAINDLFETLREELPNCKIILHKARFTDIYYDKNNQLNKMNPSIDVKELNKYWDTLDRYILEKFNVQFIDLNEKKYFSYEQHPWGVFGVHYEMNYYGDFLKSLHKLVLANYLSTGKEVYREIFDVIK